jgi:hypothetical protein
LYSCADLKQKVRIERCPATEGVSPRRDRRYTITMIIALRVTLLCELNNSMDDVVSSFASASLKSALHEDQELCTQLLTTIEEAVPLRILKSSISGAGAGLFGTKDVDFGCEIYRSTPLVNCVEINVQKQVCDYCYLYTESMVLPSDRFRTGKELKATVNACNECKVCYYCSKICLLVYYL